MGMRVNERTLTMSFLLYTINMERMCDANYVTYKVQTLKKICNFHKKILNFQKKICRRPVLMGVEPHT